MSGKGKVNRKPAVEPWDAVWADRLDVALERAAAQLSTQVLGKRSPPFGILPAVYFPRLRMGSVVYHRWGKAAPEVARAFPWKPGFIPPPFTCFAPPVAATDRVSLITDVARILDRVSDPEGSVLGERTSTSDNSAWRPDKASPLLLHSPALNMWVGLSSWQEGDGVGSAVDEYLLKAARVKATTCVFALPELGVMPSYVPLLYLQYSKQYDRSKLEQALRDAILPGAAAESAPAIGDALLAAAEAARLHAAMWITPKSGLLNQTGFDTLKDDLQRRVANGEPYAELFFDIDHFKGMNDRLGYLGADWVAAELSDRVLYFAQRDAARDYAAHRGRASLKSGLPNGFRALLAHVSGDEFKLFVQSDAVRKSYVGFARGNASTQMETDVVCLTTFAEHLVAAAAQPIAAPEKGAPEWESIHHNAFERTRASRLFTGSLKVREEPISVSLGVALLDPKRRDRAPLDQKPRNFPSTPAELEPYRRGLDDLNTLVERAIEGAKRRGRNRVMFSDALLDDGGVVSESKSG